MKGLSHLPADARLWLYQSDRKLNETEIYWLNVQLETFAAEWATHGQAMVAGGAVVNPYFIALAVDMKQVGASGCSIDKSVRFVKSVGSELGVNFFDRLKLWALQGGNDAERIAFAQLGQNPERIIYNPLLESLGELNERFEIKAAELLPSA